MVAVPGSRSLPPHRSRSHSTSHEFYYFCQPLKWRILVSVLTSASFIYFAFSHLEHNGNTMYTQPSLQFRVSSRLAKSNKAYPHPYTIKVVSIATVAYSSAAAAVAAASVASLHVRCAMYSMPYRLAHSHSNRNWRIAFDCSPLCVLGALRVCFILKSLCVV